MKADPTYPNTPERASHEEVAARIARLVRTDGTVEPIDGLSLHRYSRPNTSTLGVYKPSLCIIAQGSKEISVGGQRYHYDQEHYLLVAIELPFAGRILDASSDHPYLGASVALDPAEVGSVLVDMGLAAPRSRSDPKGLVVSAFDADLFDAVLRLVRLAATPAHAPVLAPLVTREIIYRLLLGEQGHLLRQFALLGGTAHPIARAIERLRREYNQPLEIEALAREIGMSSSGFHAHFKAITDMSPLQFQKHLRLQEARRLMLGERLDAGSAGLRVGYGDPAHFSRDYKKHFGAAPSRDVEQLRVRLGGTAQ